MQIVKMHFFLIRFTARQIPHLKRKTFHLQVHNGVITLCREITLFYFTNLFRSYKNTSQVLGAQIKIKDFIPQVLYSRHLPSRGDSPLKEGRQHVFQLNKINLIERAIFLDITSIVLLASSRGRGRKTFLSLLFPRGKRDERTRRKENPVC